MSRIRLETDLSDVPEPTIHARVCEIAKQQRQKPKLSRKFLQEHTSFQSSRHMHHDLLSVSRWLVSGNMSSASQKTQREHKIRQRNSNAKFIKQSECKCITGAQQTSVPQTSLQIKKFEKIISLAIACDSTDL